MSQNGARDTPTATVRWWISVLTPLLSTLLSAVVLYLIGELREIRIKTERLEATCWTAENWERVGRPAPQTLREMDRLQAQLIQLQHRIESLHDGMRRDGARRDGRGEH